MPAVTPGDLLPAGDVASMTPEDLNERLAEAARHAVLNRLTPVLRHSVAGSMQPVRMMLTVLERRAQATDPDLEALAKMAASIRTLAKQGSSDCMSALGWMASSENIQVSLFSSVDEAVKMLAMELAVNELELVNRVVDDSASAPRDFVRSVFIAAVLAFCDHHAAGGSLQVTFEAAAADSQQPGQLRLRLLPGGTGQPPAFRDSVRECRLIGWPDVRALAQSCGVRMARGDGWLTLDLPNPLRIPEADLSA